MKRRLDDLRRRGPRGGRPLLEALRARHGRGPQRFPAPLSATFISIIIVIIATKFIIIIISIIIIIISIIIHFATLAQGWLTLRRCSSL